MLFKLKLYWRESVQVISSLVIIFYSFWYLFQYGIQLTFELSTKLFLAEFFIIFVTLAISAQFAENYIYSNRIFERFVQRIITALLFILGCFTILGTLPQIYYVTPTELKTLIIFVSMSVISKIIYLSLDFKSFKETISKQTISMFYSILIVTLLWLAITAKNLFNIDSSLLKLIPLTLILFHLIISGFIMPFIKLKGKSIL